MQSITAGAPDASGLLAAWHRLKSSQWCANHVYATEPLFEGDSFSWTTVCRSHLSPVERPLQRPGGRGRTLISVVCEAEREACLRKGGLQAPHKSNPVHARELSASPPGPA